MELSSTFYWFILIGLAAQLVDGALGMAFGLVSSTILLSLGIPPAQVSASIHAAEVFTTGVSGVSHLSLGNVDKSLLLKLAIPGMVGGAIGAYVLTQIPGDVIRPFVYLYLLVLSVFILLRAVGKLKAKKEFRHIAPLGFFSGLLDATGGGGWGPLATSTLLANGGKVRATIGTVNTAEFLVTLVISATFFFSIGLEHLEIVLGLLIGGVIAAPFAAVLVKYVRERWVLAAVGILVISISLYQVSASLLMALKSS